MPILGNACAADTELDSLLLTKPLFPLSTRVRGSQGWEGQEGRRAATHKVALVRAGYDLNCIVILPE